MEIGDLGAAGALLSWDHATFMPSRGVGARSRQSALLGRIAHERSVDPALGRLLDDLLPHAGRLPDDDAHLVRVARRDFERAIKIPPDWVERANAHGAASFDAWTRARPANDFAAMLPFLQRTLDLSREYVDFFAPFAHPADPLIDDSDEGMTAAALRPVFAELKRALVPLARAVAERPPVDARCLEGHFDRARQLAFNRLVAERIGYDFNRGRLDETFHPFCTKFSIDDVRITTRVREDDLGEALFSTLHEAGHALYEQGVDPAFEGTPLARGTSAGVHESQSRLWENVVARSRGFWRHFHPQLREAFPEQLGTVATEDFYRAINKVERSLIRTDADEVTYNLHIMLRFDLELALLEGRLPVSELPEAWRAGMLDLVGLAPPDHRDGCLQDVHWFAGVIGGAFQSYTIGNILAVQFHEAAVRAHPEIPSEIEQGRFDTLHGWLREHVYRHGRRLSPNALVECATGAPMSMQPYLAYLRTKYGEIYDLP
jgi:carboxypeptidase Taq